MKPSSSLKFKKVYLKFKKKKNKVRGNFIYILSHYEYSRLENISYDNKLKKIRNDKLLLGIFKGRCYWHARANSRYYSY